MLHDMLLKATNGINYHECVLDFTVVLSLVVQSVKATPN